MPASSPSSPADAGASTGIDTATKSPAEVLARVPISFEANTGHFDSRVAYLARTGPTTAFFTRSSVVFSIAEQMGDVDARREALRAEVPPPETKTHVMTMSFAGARDDVAISGEGLQEGKTNYFIGNDPTKWQTNAPNYSRIRYSGIYEGIDLVFYDKPGVGLEYDFVVAPLADPNQIRLGFDGTDGIRAADDGALIVSTPLGEMVEGAPYIYQESDGVRRQILGAFVTDGKTSAGFEIADYDREHAIVIDPTIAYSSFLGGSADDVGYSIAVDSTGATYLTGYTTSTNFPTQSPFQAANAASHDAFIAKVNAAGSALVYSSYLGGSGDDYGYDVAVDSTGAVYLTGYTTSTDFPTQSPFQGAFAGFYDAFVTKVNAAGSALVYSSYLGGSSYDEGQGIAVDPTGATYLAGHTWSTNFPTQSPFQAANAGTYDAFLTKVNAAGSALVYSSYLGGTRQDFGFGVAVDPTGAAYLTGWTYSTDFPTQSPFQGAFAGGVDVFVTKVNAPGSALVYSSYLGGSNTDGGKGIAADSTGAAYLTGYTASTNFPTQSPFQAANAGGEDTFVTKVNTAGSALVYSSYLGGSANDRSEDIAIDSTGAAYPTGWTYSTDFPTQSPLQAVNGGSDDVFVTKVNAAGSALVYSSYLGKSADDVGYGVAVDTIGDAYLTGYTLSTNFPTQSPFQAANAGGDDVFVTKIVMPPVSTSILAEGSTAGGFETWVLLANPDPVNAATAKLTFLTGAGPVAGPVVNVPAQSRKSIRANDYVTSYDVSTLVEGLDRRVVAERAVYSGVPGYQGAHLGKEITETVNSWFLAEGASTGGFETWVLVVNPDPVNSAAVQVTYLTGSGPAVGPAFVLGPRSRKSVRVNDTVATYHVSTKVESTGAGVAAERATYVSGGAYRGATVSPGAREASDESFVIAEGATDGGFDTWILVANPDPVNNANVQLTYFTGSGPVVGPAFVLGPESRKSVKVNDTVTTYDVSTKVTSTGANVAAERAQYSNHPTLGMTAVSGEATTRASDSWLLPEGATAGGFETWILVANPDPAITATVEVTYLTGSGPVTGPAFALGPQSRKSVRVNDTVSTYDVSTRVTSTGTKVVADHAVYSPPGASHDATGGPGIAMS